MLKDMIIPNMCLLDITCYTRVPINQLISYLTIKNQSIWHMDIPTDSFWTLRKIPSVRHLGQPLIQYHIGNRLSNYLWLDNWHSLGPLHLQFGENVEFNLWRSLHAKVASIIQEGQWCWPRRRNRTIQFIMEHTSPTLLPDVTSEDFVTWLTHARGNFTTNSAWNAIRQKFPVQKWHSVIWFGQHVPRWSFISWLAIQQKLNTCDRLVKWGMRVDDICKLCSSAQESHLHLFFSCPFSKAVWLAVRGKNRIHNGPKSLMDIVEWKC